MAGLAELEPDHERLLALKAEARAIVQSIANAISRSGPAPRLPSIF